MLRATLIVAAIATATVGWASPANADPCYINSNGDCVPYPTHAPTPPACATAICRDGSLLVQ